MEKSLTDACLCCGLILSCSRASDYGLMKIDQSGRIIQFAEKPKGPDLEAMVIKNAYFVRIQCFPPFSQIYVIKGLHIYFHSS